MRERKIRNVNKGESVRLYMSSRFYMERLVGDKGSAEKRVEGKSSRTVFLGKEMKKK